MGVKYHKDLSTKRERDGNDGSSLLSRQLLPEGKRRTKGQQDIKLVEKRK